MRILMFALIFALGFVGCKNAKDSARDSAQNAPEAESVVLNLANNERRFYLLEGVVGDIPQKAYWHISTGGQSIILQDGFEKLNVPLNADLIKIHDISGNLTIEGIWESSLINRKDSAFAGKNFVFTLAQNPINHLVSFGSNFSRQKRVSEVDIEFTQSIARAFIPQNQALDSAIVDKINAQIALSPSLESAIALQQEAMEANFSDFTKDNEWEFNFQNDIIYRVIYLDSEILMLERFEYDYTGGAHGVGINTFEAYSLKNGEKIPSALDALIDFSQNHALERLLAILNDKLATQKGIVFEDALPLKKLPNSFYLTHNGVVFVWNVYEISAFASGQAEAFVDFAHLRDLAKRDSAFWYLFAKHKNSAIFTPSDLFIANATFARNLAY